MEEKISAVNRAADTIIYLSFNVFSPAHPVKRHQAEERFTLHHVFELLPERLCDTAKNLRSAHNMLALLPLLRNFGNDTHRHIFTFKRIKFYVNLIYQKNNALETVIIPVKTIQPGIGHITEMCIRDRFHCRTDNVRQVPDNLYSRHVCWAGEDQYRCSKKSISFETRNTDYTTALNFAKF